MYNSQIEAMNMSQMNQQMRHNQSCIQQSLSRMHSLHTPCCHSYCQPPPPAYDNEEVNYKLKRLKLQNKVLQNELNRKQVHSEEMSSRRWRRECVSPESEESLECYNISSPLKSPQKATPQPIPQRSPPQTQPSNDMQQLRAQAMQLLRVIEQDDKMFSHFRNYFMNITDFMHALNNNHYSSILIQFIQFVQEMLKSQVGRSRSPERQECPMRSCQTYSTQNLHNHATCSSQKLYPSSPPLLYPCEQQQMYTNYMNKQQQPAQQAVQYSPQSLSRMHRPSPPPPPVYQSLQQPLPRQSSLKQEPVLSTPKDRTFGESWGRDKSMDYRQERTLNHMRNTFQDGPRLQEASLSKTKPSVHKDVCPHLSRSLKKKETKKKTMRTGPRVQPREPTYWAEDIAPVRKVHSQSTQMNRIIKGQQ